MNKNRRRKKVNSIVHGKSSSNSFFSSLVNKIMITICIYLVFAIVAEDRNFDLSKVNQFISEKVGNVLPFQDYLLGDTQAVFSELNLDVLGSNEYKSGYMLTLSSKEIKAFENGIVFFNEEVEDYGKILSVKQSDGIEVWYGNLSDNDYQLYDFVKKGELIGQINEDELFLAILKDGKFITYDEYLQYKN